LRAIRLHAFGPPENLVLEEVDDPQPGPGQVRIAVGAAGMHFIDAAIRAGRRMGPAALPDLPQIPGREVAGTVDGVGPGVDDAWLGRRAVAHLGPASGGYAELAVRDVDAVHALDDRVSDVIAVAMIGTGRTAMAILDVAEPRSDDIVLITAAAGGIGALLVQAARNAGAQVVGAAGGAEKAARVRDLGVRAVDYAAAGWAEEVGEVTLALDGVGGAIGRTALECVGRGGRLDLFGFASGEPTPLSAGDVLGRGLTVAGALGRSSDQRALEDRALAAAASGALVPLTTVFPLADAAAAHSAIEARATVGKVVLVPWPRA
jgi:NADPH2:quinone reductase